MKSGHHFARFASSLFLILIPLISFAQTKPVVSEHAKPPALTLTDLWTGKAMWVGDANQIGSTFGFHFPSIIQDQRDLWAYYIHGYISSDGKSKMAIARARGTDGIRWIDEGMVLDVGRGRQSTNTTAPEWDDRMTSFPGAWKEGDTWYLVYEGASETVAGAAGDIGLATSTDGKHFTKHPKNPILRHETTGWEQVNIGTPSLYKENGVWYLFYHGYDGKVCQIGVASGKSLSELTRSAANPILPVAPDAAAWDSGTTGRRSRIVKEGDHYYLAYEGSTPQPFLQSKWSSGIARTRKLTEAWEKFPANPMIPQTPGGMNHDGPELLRLGDTWYLYVRHAEAPHGNATQRYRLSAVSASPKRS